MSKLWHDVQPVEWQPLEWPHRRLRQILVIGTICLTAALCIQSLYLNRHAQKLAVSRVSVNQAQDILGSGAAPEVLLAAAQALHLGDPGAARTAVSLTRASLAKQPDQPFAWAELAFYQTRLKGRLDDEAILALQTSVDQCGYCDKQLLRWRLSFALDHWAALPESLRLEIFRGAEFLRWWHIDGAFLAEARQHATALGIDFREYQRRVVSDVRPHEVMPAN